MHPKKQLTNFSEFSNMCLKVRYLWDKVFKSSVKYHHENGPMVTIRQPLPSRNLVDVVSDWDAAYADSWEEEMVFEMIL